MQRERRMKHFDSFLHAVRNLVRRQASSWSIARSKSKVARDIGLAHEVLNLAGLLFAFFVENGDVDVRLDSAVMVGGWHFRRRSSAVDAATQQLVRVLLMLTMDDYNLFIFIDSI